jgi:hypothetical protein
MASNLISLVGAPIQTEVASGRRDNLTGRVIVQLKPTLARHGADVERRRYQVTNGQDAL